MDLSVPDSLPAQLQDRANYQNLVAGQVLFHYRDPAELIFALEYRVHLTGFDIKAQFSYFFISFVLLVNVGYKSPLRSIAPPVILLRMSCTKFIIIVNS